MSNNYVSLTGNLGNDIELRYTANGTSVANFRLATHENWDQDGKKRSHTEWHRIVVWGGVANLCAEELKKGSFVKLTGKLRTRSWNDRDGNTRFVTEVHVYNVKTIPRKAENTSSGLNNEEIPF